MEQRNCTFFLSSTFKDFGEERDILHFKILPAINTAAAIYGQTADVVDLRWGINTADYDISEKSARILKICLDEIDDCRPYFIIFLGERYGWIPPVEDVESVLAQRGITELPTNISITETEISYELFMRYAEKENVIVCMRKSLAEEPLGEYASVYLSENEEAMRRMEALKSRLRQQLGDLVIEYDAKWDPVSCRLVGLEAFESALKDRLLALLARTWADYKEMDRHQLLQIRMWREAESIAERFVGDCSPQLRQLSAYKGDTLRVLSDGDAETSDLMATFALKMRAEGKNVFLLFCDRANEIGNKRELQAHIEAFLERHPKGDCLLVLDAYDKILEPADDHYLFHMPHSNKDGKGKCVYYLARRSREKYEIRCAERRENELAYTVRLTEEGREAVIKRELHLSHKLVDGEVFSFLKQACTDRSPFFVRMLVGRLILINKGDLTGCVSDTEINERIIALVSDLPDDEETLFAFMCRLVSDRVSSVFCERVLGLLELSHGGLREGDLEYIFSVSGWEWKTLYFAELRHYTRFLMEEHPGRYYRLTRALPREWVTNEVRSAFETALRAVNAQKEQERAFVCREGLVYAYAHKDVALAKSVVLALENEPNADHLFAAHSDGLIIWCLEVLKEPEISAATCASFGKLLSELAHMFPKDEMDMPTYQSMAAECFVIANRKGEDPAMLEQIIKNCKALTLSLGAHWTNDFPEALPHMDQLCLRCYKRLYELGQRTQKDLWSMLFLSIPTTLYYLKEGTAKNIMPFLETGELAPAEIYAEELVTEMHRAYRAGYVFRTDATNRAFGKYRHDYKTSENDPVLGVLRDREAAETEKDKVFRLGYGNQGNIAIEELITLFSDTDAMLAIKYWSDLSVTERFDEWKKRIGSTP